MHKAINTKASCPNTVFFLSRLQFITFTVIDTENIEFTAAAAAATTTYFCLTIQALILTEYQYV